MELKIEYLPIKALNPYEKNTRKHQKKDIDNIARSIERYGMNDPNGRKGGAYQWLTQRQKSQELKRRLPKRNLPL